MPETATFTSPDVADQLALWGYALTGNAADLTALAAENPAMASGVVLTWDHDRRWLATTQVGHGDEPMRPPRPWAALPWLAEHVLRGHMEWPGL